MYPFPSWVVFYRISSFYLACSFSVILYLICSVFNNFSAKNCLKGSFLLVAPIVTVIPIVGEPPTPTFLGVSHAFTINAMTNAFSLIVINQF